MSMSVTPSSDRELAEAVVGVSQGVKRLLTSYDQNRDPGELDFLVYQVNKLYRIVTAFNSCRSEVLELIGVGLSLLQELQSSQGVVNTGGYVPQELPANCRGRPRLDIKKEQLEYLLHMGFSCPKIASVIGVSLSTIRRRMSDYGLCVTALYSNITDHELDSLVTQIKENFPNCGYRLMQGHLLRQGHRISQARIRECMHRVDPDGVAIRWAAAVQRRKYTVSSPLSLWHIDGNHKLIRWRLVIHGGVDGFSRIPVFLYCSSNNQADTVLRLFKEAISTYGLPSRVRCDQGGENVDVSMFLLTHPLRGPGRGTVIVGKSVHNQRIERMWRDVYQGVIGLFRDLFHYLESINMLDPDNDLQLFCLHSVFIPRINRHLKTWKEAWIKHPIRSEHNFSPEQLWTAGLQRIAGSGSHIAREVFEDLREDEAEHFGIDWEGPIADTDGMVNVPETECPLLSADMDELQATVPPLASSTQYGIDLYEKTLNFVSRKLNVTL